MPIVNLVHGGHAHLLQSQPVLLEQALPVIRRQGRRLAAVQLVIDDIRVGLIAVRALIVWQCWVELGFRPGSNFDMTVEVNLNESRGARSALRVEA